MPTYSAIKLLGKGLIAEVVISVRTWRGEFSLFIDTSMIFLDALDYDSGDTWDVFRLNNVYPGAFLVFPYYESTLEPKEENKSQILMSPRSTVQRCLYTK